MINLYVKFNLYSSYGKQVTVLKVADRRTEAAPGDNDRYPPKLWPKPKTDFLVTLSCDFKRQRDTTASE